MPIPTPNRIEFSVAAAEAGQRVDRVITAHVESLSRTAIQRLIAGEQVTVNGAPIKPRRLLQDGDQIAICVPPPEDATAQPEDIALNIVYEDGDIIIINKPPDMVVHPAPGAYSGTLVNALLHHCKDLSGIGGVKRPGIVHRIDKDTTGLLAVAKNDAAHESLTAQLATRSMKRSYMVLVSGTINEESGTISAPIGRSKYDRTKMAVNPDGREARTNWRVLKRTHGLTLAQADLDTGRSHQIRVHFQYLGYPVIGDQDYGTSPKQMAARLPERAVFLRQWVRSAPRQMLHAFRLTLKHPRTGKEMTFEAPPPEDFQRLIDHLKDAD